MTTILSNKFLLNETALTWQEAKWGVERQMADRTLFVELALRRESATSTCDPQQLELAGLFSNELADASLLVDRLIAREQPQQEEQIRRKWLFLNLLWLYEHRSRLPDPLQAVEGVFCDFGHPLEIASFIKYMPPSDGYDPRVHTRTENLERLMEKWSTYIATGRLEFGARPTATP